MLSVNDGVDLLVHCPQNLQMFGFRWTNAADKSSWHLPSQFLQHLPDCQDLHTVNLHLCHEAETNLSATEELKYCRQIEEALLRLPSLKTVSFLITKDDGQPRTDELRDVLMALFPRLQLEGVLSFVADDTIDRVNMSFLRRCQRLNPEPLEPGDEYINYFFTEADY